VRAAVHALLRAGAGDRALRPPRGDPRRPVRREPRHRADHGPVPGLAAGRVPLRRLDARGVLPRSRRARVRARLPPGAGALAGLRPRLPPPAVRLRPEQVQLPRVRPAAGTGEIDVGDAPAKEVLRERVQHSPYAPSGLPDRQVATLEFASGTLATFTAVMAQPRSTRRLRI